jgi:hypothetical protein
LFNKGHRTQLIRYLTVCLIQVSVDVRPGAVLQGWASFEPTFFTMPPRGPPGPSTLLRASEFLFGLWVSIGKDSAGCQRTQCPGVCGSSLACLCDGVDTSFLLHPGLSIFMGLCGYACALLSLQTTEGESADVFPVLPSTGYTRPVLWCGVHSQTHFSL